MNKLKATLEKALLEAGAIMNRKFFLPKKVEYKSRANLVTQTDRDAEKKIADIIFRVFPNHVLLGEETANVRPGTFVKARPLPYKWIVDPIDGTTNFAHGLPIVSVSIALEQDGVVTMGGVWNPLLKEMFFAELGKGAFLNGKKIRVSKTPDLESSLLVTGFPYDKSRFAFNRIMKSVEEFLMVSHGIRRLGSAAIDLCYIACGRFDGYWESKLQPWDQAAGALVAREAGARLTNFRGGKFDLYDQETLATNGRIHAEMLKRLRKLWR